MICLCLPNSPRVPSCAFTLLQVFIKFAKQLGVEGGL